MNITYCKECEKKGTNLDCTKCISNYYFFNDVKRQCLNTGQISSMNDYFLKNDEYYSFINYNLISNCKECGDKNSCKMCVSDYTFINDSKLSCLKIINLGQNYTKDINDPTIYRKCSEYIEYCVKCESYQKCLTCEINYILTNDRKCINTSDTRYYKDSTDNQF